MIHLECHLQLVEETFSFLSKCFGQETSKNLESIGFIQLRAFLSILDILRLESIIVVNSEFIWTLKVSLYCRNCQLSLETCCCKHVKYKGWWPSPKQDLLQPLYFTPALVKVISAQEGEIWEIFNMDLAARSSSFLSPAANDTQVALSLPPVVETNKNIVSLQNTAFVPGSL